MFKKNPSPQVAIKTVDFYKGVTIVRLAGSVTLDNLETAQAEFRSKTADRPVKNILFDMKDVSGSDSSGLAALVDLLKYMKGHGTGGRIGLINIPDKITALLAISKTEPLFTEYPSEEFAITSLQ